jgi:PKHD-type hydroxylase
MILKYSYWTFPSVLSKNICNDILKLGKKNKEKIALIGDTVNLKKTSKKYINNLKKKRNSNIVWLNDRWIYDTIHPYVNLANKLAGWNFDWDYSESCQFTKYKVNQFYEWHCDTFVEPYNTPNDLNFHGKIRKLSVTCSLSDPKDYKGGELEFDIMDEKNKSNIIQCKEILPRGSICVFPSHIRHRVRPVTKGTRYSLVIWNIGHPFR